ncbi:MAG: carboxypeptidase-like regulatory domain-containing protein [Gemmatimonadaceae bacterium]
MKLCAVTIALAIPLVTKAQAQTHHDVIRGTVITDSGKALAGVDVIATMAPDRLSEATKTDNAGKYEIVFEHGTGDYLVHFSAVGRQTFRKRVTRTGNDSVFVVDAKLGPAEAQQLAAVKVQAKKPKPDRDRRSIDPGGAERTADGVNGAVPPDQAGDIAAIAGTIPGVAVTPGGVSVGGLSSAQNSTTLNGMAFPGGDVPRDASTRVRVSSSTYDPARGWFSGLQQNVELSQGNLFSFRRAHLTVDAPALQYTDPTSAALGQRFTNLQASIGGDGPLLEGDKFVYNYGAQAGRRSSDLTSLGGASADLLARAGVSSDSVARLFSVLSAGGVPIGGAGLPTSRMSQSASFIGRIDHAPYDWKTFTPAKQTWGLLGYAKVASSDAVGIGPTATLTHGGNTSEATGMVQGLFSSYIHGDYLTEATSAASVNRRRAEPFVEIPEGRVLVASSLPDGTDGVMSLAFGGNGLLNDTRQWTWETTSETQFYVPGRSAHRVKLNADLRFDGVREDANPNMFGTFAFNSLADLAANRPTSFTRTLNSPVRTSGEWNSFVALGDLWRKSQTFQVLYGVRVEGNRFTSTAAFNPLVQSLFGLRTDNAPNTMHVSPRAGFTWVRKSKGQGMGMMGNPIGMFILSPTSYVRGGIGEFRSLIPGTLLTTASVATGLPNGLQSLTCLGGAAPVPN